MKKTKRGFTIVELVIVIGVIAILSAVLIPTFVNLSSKATDAKTKQEVADAYSSYVIDVADGYYGEPSGGTKIEGEPYAQDKVWVVHGEESYQFGSNGWEKGSYTVDADNKLGGTYNGCTLYHK